MTPTAFIPADAPRSSVPPTPQEFQLSAARACPYWDCGPWPDANRRTQAVLGYWKACVWKPEYDPRFEHAALLLLNSEQRLLGHFQVKRGGQSYVFPDSSLWFGPARLLGASYLIEVHTHGSCPSAQPSQDDILSGRELARFATASGIPLLDMIAVADGEACSLAANGLLDGADDSTGPHDEPEAVLNAREEWKLAYWIVGNDRELLGLVIDQAHKEGVSPEHWLFNFVRGEARLHFAGFLGRDEKLSFVANGISRQPDEKELMLALMDEAADRDMSTRECAWTLGIELFRERLRARLAAKNARED